MNAKELIRFRLDDVNSIKLDKSIESYRVRIEKYGQWVSSDFFDCRNMTSAIDYMQGYFNGAFKKEMNDTSGMMITIWELSDE